MKSIFIKLDKPCSENWETMKANESGRFCEQCSKTVVDFTTLNPFEIGQKMKMAKGNICARVSQNQLNEPLLDFEAERKRQLPYSNLAAGLMMATTMATNQPLLAKTTHLETEMVQTADSILENNYNSKPKPENKKTEKFITFSGIVQDNENLQPIKNAKIIFVTIRKQFTAYSQDDGTFSIKIPTELIDNDNVIRVLYNETKEIYTKVIPYRYKSNDYILTKEEMNFIYKIKAFPEKNYVGGAIYYSREERNPAVLINGQEINYKDYMTSKYEKKGNLNLENKDYLYFKSEAAIALYGQKAIYGLYILNDKTEK